MSEDRSGVRSGGLEDLERPRFSVSQSVDFRVSIHDDADGFGLKGLPSFGNRFRYRCTDGGGDYD